jgi:hypothetical protein
MTGVRERERRLAQRTPRCRHKQAFLLRHAVACVMGQSDGVTTRPLSELLDAIDGPGVFLAGAPVGGVGVSGISYDSNTTGHRDLFFCLRGEHSDGHLFAGDAIA